MRLRFNGCVLDARARALARDALPVHVEPKVLDLLVLLAQHRDRVVTKDELLEALWPDAVVGEAALSRLVKEARRAVGDDGARQSVIKTHHRRGFRFVAMAVEDMEDGEALPTRPSGDFAGIEAITNADDTSVSLTLDGRRSSPQGILWLFPEFGSSSIPAFQALLLGRGDACSTRLPGRDVSRQHAQLVRDGHLLVLRDLSSRNGTFVNGTRVTHAPLAPGDVVRLGDWVGVVAPRPEVPYQGLREVGFGVLAGPLMERRLQGLKNVADDAAPVVIQGETGSGKSSIARALHGWGSFSGALVTVACSARPESFSLEAHLRRELDELNCATVLLDNVTELSPRAQGELVRLLDEAVIRTDSGDDVALRFVVTTDGMLELCAADGSFRADLCSRLSAVRFIVPPLRERVEEIPSLFLHFLRRHSEYEHPPVQARLIERLCLYEWPFNVRELEHVARQLVFSHGREPTLRSSLLPGHVKPASEPPDGSPSSE